MPLDSLAEELKAEINHAIGPNTVFTGSEMIIPERFTSGSLSLDIALGGGWPANQWVEVLGKESAGKTAMIYKTIAANQRKLPDYSTFWVASETYDVNQSAALGVDNDRVLVVPTQEMELAFSMLLHGVQSQKATCLVLDSFPALIPDEEAAKSMDEIVVATGARLMNKFVRKAGKASKRSPLGLDRPFHGFVVNQYRDTIGWAPIGSPGTTPGGKGKNYFFYTRVEVTRDGYITEKMEGHDKPVPVGQHIRYATIKNKSASPQQRAYVDLYFRDAPEHGFLRGDYDLGKEYVDVGVVYGVILKTGGNHYYRDNRIGTSKEKTQEAVRHDADLREALRQDVMEAVTKHNGSLKTS